MGPISKMGGCRVGGGQFPGKSHGGVPNNSENTLTLLAGRYRQSSKESQMDSAIFGNKLW
jgi:hypothetical protein